MAKSQRMVVMDKLSSSDKGIIVSFHLHNCTSQFQTEEGSMLLKPMLLSENLS